MQVVVLIPGWKWRENAPQSLSADNQYGNAFYFFLTTQQERIPIFSLRFEPKTCMRSTYMHTECRACMFTHINVWGTCSQETYTHKYKHFDTQNSRLNQSNFKGESEQSGHPNYAKLYGETGEALEENCNQDLRQQGAMMKWLSSSAVNMKAWNCKFMTLKFSVQQPWGQPWFSSVTLLLYTVHLYKDAQVMPLGMFGTRKI